MDPTLVTFEDCVASLTVRRHGLEHPRGIVDRRVTKFVKVRKSPKDLPRVIGEVCVTLLKGNTVRTWCLGLCVLDWVSGTVCPRV